MTTDTGINVNLDFFIQDVRKLEAHAKGMINITTCMGIVKDLHEEGYHLSINRSQPFFVNDFFYQDIMDQSFKELQTGDGVVVHMKIVKKKVEHDTLEFFYVFIENQSNKFAQVYKISKSN